ncbi:MAG: hypothetical protein JWN30_809, partial [Bacilli bacterium]|nr:hypothetical protein [Bacilli bacterium]
FIKLIIFKLVIFIKRNHVLIVNQYKHHLKSKPFKLLSIVSVIIPASEEEKRIGQVVREVRKLGKDVEILVVANGCTDQTIPLAREAGAKVIEIPEKLGHDVGRAIGAKQAKGDILLFIDGDMVIAKEDLIKFVDCVQAGNDVALNSYPNVQVGVNIHPVNIAKYSLNVMLGRQDLKASTLTAVPHALSKRAVKKIGCAALSIPPLAHARSILKGLKVTQAHFVQVGVKNPLRKSRYLTGQDPVTMLILGDCIEALDYVIGHRGPRGNFTDLNRQREMIGELMLAREEPSEDEIDNEPTAELVDTPDEVFPETTPRPVQLVVTVIPVRNEGKTIRQVISSALEAGAAKVVVVSNGTTDNSANLATAAGADVCSYEQAVGHDVGRGLGVLQESGEAYLFLDGDIHIRKEDLSRFIASMEEDIDIGLNDLTNVLQGVAIRDPVTMLKLFLNLVLNRKDLGAASLTAVPHIARAEAIRVIGVSSLCVPPLAHTKAILAGLRVKAVQEVDVIKTNLFRRELHQHRFGKPLQQLIIGDHLEAIHYLITSVGKRGYFADDIRRRDLLQSYLNN